MELQVFSQNDSPRSQREGIRAWMSLRLEGAELDFNFRQQNSALRCPSPDGLLTADAGSLIVTDAAGLAESDTAGSAGPVTQGAPEPGTDQAGGDQHHQQGRHRGGEHCELCRV